MNGLRCVPPAPWIMADLYAEYCRVAKDQGITFSQYLAAVGYTNPAVDVHGMDDGSVYHAPAAGPELIAVPSQPITGALRVIVLLVDFPDLPGTLPPSHYTELLFSKDSHPTGSMRDYYREVSLDKVDIGGSVHGWLRLPHGYSYYTNGNSGLGRTSYPNNGQGMAEDAVRAALQAGATFSADLDRLGNGAITALFLVHSGLGAEEQPRAVRGNHIWSHKWTLRQAIAVRQGLVASTYLTVPQPCRLGVCAHELGHLAFQWDDFYDPNYGEDGQAWDGSGQWDLMAGGSYNGASNRPAHPAGLHKSQHGWVQVEEVKGSKSLRLPPYSATAGKVAKLVSPKYRAGQYLVLENRSRRGFDADLPGEGLLVWRVDESMEQTAPSQPAMLLIQADGRHQLERSDDWNEGDTGDPFPGSANRSDLGDTGDISTSFPNGDRAGVGLRNIVRDPETGEIAVEVVFEADTGGGTGAGQKVLRKEVSPGLVIPDAAPAGVTSVLAFTEDGITQELALDVDIEHGYVGDLRVELTAPSGQTAVLQDQVGGPRVNLLRSWRSTELAALATLLGSAVRGNWTLRVVDGAPRDLGKLRRWALTIAADQRPAGLQEEVPANLPIPDDDPVGVASVARISRAGVARSLEVRVDVTHPYVGDLRIELTSPDGRVALLHNRSGGDGHNLERTFRSANDASLAVLVGASVRGDWTLRVMDMAGRDEGVLNSWSLGIALASEAKTFEQRATPGLAIPDNNTVGVGSAMAVQSSGTAQAIEVSVDIMHAYVGDLRVELVAPWGARAVLQDRSGGRSRDLLARWTSTNSPALAQLTGQPIQGPWILQVSDRESLDTGTLRSWVLKLTYGG